jgi:orotidine-5'-phosphate decarboxylase
MNSYNKIINLIEKKKNLLCVGLDSDLSKIPKFLLKSNNNTNDLETLLESLLEFNKFIIDLTKNDCISYKINFAFYEQYGFKGMEIIEKTLDYIPKEIFTIADAKRGDIGNTSKSYAKSVFEHLNFDSITISPYMGHDSIAPFLEFEDKMTFLLCLTSNPGSADLQRLKIGKFCPLINQDMSLYHYIMDKYSEDFNKESIGFVVGATHPDELAELRKINSKSVFLIPGIGVQGGDLNKTIEANYSNNLNKLEKSPCLINVSRAVIYAGDINDSEDIFSQNVIKTCQNYANDIKSLIK